MASEEPELIDKSGRACRILRGQGGETGGGRGPHIQDCGYHSCLRGVEPADWCMGRLGGAGREVFDRSRMGPEIWGAGGGGQWSLVVKKGSCNRSGPERITVWETLGPKPTCPWSST